MSIRLCQVNQSPRKFAADADNQYSLIWIGQSIKLFKGRLDGWLASAEESPSLEVLVNARDISKL